MLARNKLTPGATSIEAGRLGQIEIRGSEIMLGAPLMFNKANIDRYDFSTHHQPMPRCRRSSE